MSRFVRGVRIHGEFRRARHPAPARSIRILGLETENPLLPGLTSELYGLVQETPPEGDHAVLSAQPLRRGQALRLLDHGQLPRGLRHLCLQRHFVQPRIAVRGETFVTRKSTRALARIKLGCRTAFTSAISARGATGAMRGDFVEAMWLMLQQAQPRISSSPPASSTACANSSAAARRNWACS